MIQSDEPNAVTPNEILALRVRCVLAIDRLPQNHATMMARSKLDEMVFWLQAAVRQGSNGT